MDEKANGQARPARFACFCLSPQSLRARLSILPVLQRALAYVPASVLAALVAAGVAWISRNTVLSLAAGMGALWTLQALGW